MTATLRVDAYSEGWLRKRFPWVYPKEVAGGGARPGAEVLVRGPKGDVLGRALADDGFVAARVLRHDDGPLDQDWLDGVLDRAAALREVVVDRQTDGFRLCNAECDGLPGVRIDVWREVAVVTLDARSLDGLVPKVVDWLARRRTPRAVVQAYRTDPRDAGRDVPGPAVVHGHAPPGPVRVRERGLQFDVLPLDAPDVGLYADMREVRAWLEPTWGGARVLNTFAHTGAFSVSAAFHGASDVVSVDLSRPVLDRLDANLAANGLDPAAHEGLAEDVFKALDRFRRTGRRFDRVVLDPPAFSRGDTVWSAIRDYPRLVGAAARVLDDGGWIVAASNQGELSPKQFDGLLQEGLRKAGREAQGIAQLGQAPDFPSATWFPEGRYLKVRVLRVA